MNQALKLSNDQLTDLSGLFFEEDLVSEQITKKIRVDLARLGILPPKNENCTYSISYLEKIAGDEGWPEKDVEHLGRLAEYADSLGIELKFLENKKEVNGGCDDAAQSRRLDIPYTEEFPIYKEMKHLLFTCGGEVVCVHLRGNRMLDEDALKNTLEKKFKIKTSKKIKLLKEKKVRQLKTKRGQVNPLLGVNEKEFSGDIAKKKIHHVFDPDLFKDYDNSEEMTTNAGHGKYMIQFNPWNLFTGLKHQLGDIVSIADESICQGGESETLDKMHNYNTQGTTTVEYGSKASMHFKALLEKEIKKIISTFQEKVYSGKGIDEVKIHKAGTFSSTSARTEGGGTLERAMSTFFKNQEDVLSELKKIISKAFRDGYQKFFIPCNILPSYIPELKKYYEELCRQEAEKIRNKIIATLNQQQAGTQESIGSAADAILGLVKTERKKAKFFSMADALEEKLKTLTEEKEKNKPLKILILGGVHVSDSETSIYLNRLKEKFGDRLQVDTIDCKQAKEIDKAMMTINRDDYDEPNKVLFKILQSKILNSEGEYDFIIPASTSVEVMIKEEQEGELIGSNWLLSRFMSKDTQIFDALNGGVLDAEKLRKEINEIPLIFPMEAYADHIAREEFNRENA